MASTERISRYREYVLRISNEVRRRRYFKVSLNDREVDHRHADTDLAASFARVYPDVLRALLAVAEQCRLYDVSRLKHPNPLMVAHLGKPNEACWKWFATYTRTVKGAVEVNLASAGVLDHIDFWWWLIRSGANPLLIVQRGAFDPAAVHLITTEWTPEKDEGT